MEDTEEIERIKDVPVVEYPCFGYKCKGCGRDIELWYNGGELDETECCDYIYSLEHQAIDFVVRKKVTK